MVLVNAFFLSLLSIFYTVLGSKFLLPVNSMSLYTRVSGHNRICDILVFAIPIAMSQFITEKKKKINYLLGFLIIFFIFTLIFSFGRAAMLSLALGYLFVILFLDTEFTIRGSKKLRELIAAILGVTTIVIFMTSFLYSNFISPKNNHGLEFIYKPVKIEKRLDYYLQAIRGFRQSPFLGTGLDTFIYVSKRYQQKDSSHELSSSAHNKYLQAFTETGVFGGSLFLFFILLLFWEVCQSFSKKQGYEGSGKDRCNLGFLIALIATTIQALIDYNWDFLSISLFFFMGMALIIGKNKIQPSDRQLYSVDMLIFFPMFLAITLFLQLFIPFDSYKAQEKAFVLDRLGKTNEAKALLTASLSIDRMNTNLLTALAELNAKSGDYETAHRLYRQAILLNRINPTYLIKRDYVLYLDQIENCLNSCEAKEKDKLPALISSYQPYHQEVLRKIDSLDQLNSEASEGLRQYVLMGRKLVIQKNLTPGELEMIIKNVAELEETNYK